jgi:hypothetical protein
MKWLIALILAAQAPFLLIAFVAAGTDGRVSSQLKVWAVVIPIFVSEIYSLYRHFTSSQLNPLDWAVTAIACVPAVILIVIGLRDLTGI